MPIRRAKNGRWSFRAVLEYSDGTRKRAAGMPGAPGRYQDLPNTKQGALAAEARAKAEALTGASVFPQEPEAKEVKVTTTIREFSKTFLSDYGPSDKPSAIKARKQIINGYILEHLGDVALGDFRKKHVYLLEKKLLPGRSRKTMNNILAVLSSLMKYAVAERLISEGDLKDIKFKIKSDDNRSAQKEAVEASDVVKLVEATEDPRYRAAILLAADAGLRIGEIRALEWGEVNEVQRELSISQSVDRSGNLGPTKSWGSRVIPISSRLWDALSNLERSGRWVLSRSRGDTKKPLGYETTRQAILASYESAKVKVPPKPWHGLRHCFGTTLSANGVPVADIKELMGHESIETTLGYMHTNRAAKRDAISRLALALDGIKAPEKEKTPANSVS